MSDITARGVFLSTPQRPPLGSAVRLRHLHGGTIAGAVSAHAAGGIAVSFESGPRATAFALAVIASGIAGRA